MKSVAIFAPFSKIWQHSVAEARLALALKKIGYDVTVITCGNSFPFYCTPLELYSLEPFSDSSEIRDKICQNCQNDSTYLFSDRNLNVIKLADYISNLEVRDIKEFVSKLDIYQIRDYEESGILLGKISLYEPLIKFKKNTLVLSPLQLKFARNSLLNSIITARATQKLTSHFNFDINFVYSPQYCIPGVFAEKMIKSNKKVYFVEGSSSVSERYTHLRIWDWGKFRLSSPALQLWGEYKIQSYPIDLSSLKKVKSHFAKNDLALSPSTYSSRKQNFDIRKYFKIDGSSKIILAALSSSDEIFSAAIIDALPKNRLQSKVFISQETWILELVRWVKDHTDITLIIRMHPRDYSNKRETIKSSQSLNWENILRELPHNVRIDKPDMGISIFNYYNGIQLLTTGWSSTATEALFRNVPVVTYDNDLAPFPESIVVTGSTRSIYFRNIESVLNGELAYDYKKLVEKWLSFNFSGVIKIEGALRNRIISDRFNLFTKIIFTLEYFFPNFVKFIEINYPFSLKSLIQLKQLVDSESDHLYDLTQFNRG
jgi:hypothetical protein